MRKQHLKDISLPLFEQQGGRKTWIQTWTGSLKHLWSQQWDTEGLARLKGQQMLCDCKEERVCSQQWDTEGLARLNGRQTLCGCKDEREAEQRWTLLSPHCVLSFLCGSAGQYEATLMSNLLD